MRRVLKGTKKTVPGRDDWLLGVDTFSYLGEGGPDEDLIYSYGRSHLLTMNRSAREHMELLARRLQEHLALPEAADATLIQHEIASAIGGVLTGAREFAGLGRDLLGNIGELMARSVTAFPVAGLNFEGMENPLIRLSGRVLLAPMGDSGEAAVSEFAVAAVGQSLHFTHDAWWTEEILAFRSDPEAFDDGAPLSKVAIFAVTIDAVDYSAALRSKEQVEALLGAFWLIDQRENNWPSSPPWILGGPSRSDAPRDPGSDFDEGLPMVGLQASSRRHSTDAISFESQHPDINVARALDKRPGLIELVAEAETGSPAQGLGRRLAAACRFAWIAGQDTSYDVKLLHLVVGLESLVSDHVAAGGVTGRFISRLLSLQQPSHRDSAKLRALYDLRSEVGHQGFSDNSRSRLAKVSAYASDLLDECVFSFADTVKRHGFRSEEELLAFLDQASPDVSDPFD
ncbi:hypothetical protein ASG70_03025 [Phycicoccus sp. Soil748]|nr:hypothetical protein ASG70_03025 [Phycicoccus sp. Soil748]